MAFKKSQEFPTASLDITEDFHILLTQCLRIHLLFHPQRKNIQLAHTHTHPHPHTGNSNNYNQKATGHVTSLANGHLTDSESPFVCEIPTASSNKIRDNFADTGLAVRTPADFDPTKACKRHKTDAFTKLGEPTIRAACTPRTVAFLMPFLLLLFLPVSIHLGHGLTVPPTKACLLCVTPAGTYRVQFPGFPKIVY